MGIGIAAILRKRDVRDYGQQERSKEQRSRVEATPTQPEMGASPLSISQPSSHADKSSSQTEINCAIAGRPERVKKHAMTPVKWK